MRRFLVALAVVAILPGPLMAVTGSTPALAQQGNQAGLVNVQVGDVLNENNVGIGLAVQLVAQVCANADVTVAAVLAAIRDQGSFTGACNLTSNPAINAPISITPSQ